MNFTCNHKFQFSHDKLDIHLQPNETNVVYRKFLYKQCERRYCHVHQFPYFQDQNNLDVHSPKKDFKFFFQVCVKNISILMLTISCPKTPPAS